MVTHPHKRSGVALNQALELMAGVLPSEFESWNEVPQNYQRFRPDNSNISLLRTRVAAEVEGGAVSPEVARAKGQTLKLTGQVLSLNGWCQFEPAIRRWEAVTGNDAPEPTLPDGQKGQHRLNSRFTEWMMGLAPGWITGHGLSRRDEIKMAGNGVVPQQAVFALSVLLERLEK
jgi:DNA (cytosine-5)-methyltransferase 1